MAASDVNSAIPVKLTGRGPATGTATEGPGTYIQTDTAGNLYMRMSADAAQAAAGISANVLPYGTLGVSTDPSALFSETFEGTSLDTTRWAASVTSGGGSVTVANGKRSVTAGTTANAYAISTTNPTFPPLGGAFILYGETLSLPPVWPVHVGAYWGWGTAQASPTAALPMVNFNGFSMDYVTGGLFYDVWSAGVRTTHSSLAGLYPTDGAEHAWAVFLRGDTMVILIGSFSYTVPAGAFLAKNPAVQNLPITMMVINDSTGPGINTILTTNYLSVNDYGKNGQQISDGTNPWQKQAVDAAGSAQVGLAPTAASARAPTNVNSTAYESSHILKASAGTLYGVAGYNSKGSAQFIQLHDSATVPADAAVPALTLTAAALSNYSVDFGVYGMAFANGITVCNSSTGPTKTLGSADTWFSGRLK